MRPGFYWTVTAGSNMAMPWIRYWTGEYWMCVGDSHVFPLEDYTALAPVPDYAGKRTQP